MIVQNLMAGTALAMCLMQATGAAAETATKTPTDATPTQTSPPAAPAGSNILDGDIVVTARKTVERAQDVPISLAAIGGDTLAQKNILQIQDLTKLVSNFRQSNGSIGAFRIIRGAGAAGSNYAFEQSTGLFFDNVSYGRNVDGRLPIFDAERVEVLRGPQVLTFGNSTTSGAVSVTSRRPGNELAADLLASYEFEAHEMVVRGGISLPIIDGLAIRLSGYGEKLDKGWLHNSAPGSEPNVPLLRNYGLRALLAADLGPDTKLILKYEIDRSRGIGSELKAVYNPGLNIEVVNPGLNLETQKAQPAPFNIPNDSLHLIAHTYFGELSSKLGGADIVSTTAYTDYNYSQIADADFGPFAIGAQQPADRYRQFSEEVRLSGNVTDALHVIGGAYYQYENQRAQSLLSRNTPPISWGRYGLLTTHANQWSFYGDATYKVTPQITLELGARYTTVTRNADQTLRATLPLTTIIDPTKESPIASAATIIPHDFRGFKLTEDRLQPQAVISFKPSRNINIFAKWVRGAKAGGVDANPVNPTRDSAVFRPETAESFEGGIKSFLFDRRLELNVVLFSARYKDLQVSAYNSNINAFEVRNAGSSISKGVETDFVLAVTPQLKLSGNLAYLDAHYIDFANAPCPPEATTPFCNLSGTPTPFSAKWSGSGSIDYTAPVGPVVVHGGVTANFRTNYNASLINDPYANQKGFVLLDARLDLTTPNDRWRVSLFGENLTNKIYTDFLATASFLPRVRGGPISRPRQIGIQLGFKY
ncbi:MAG: TonB-dependent receptor [Sphingomonas sp.]|uniref:TonB-dependent receptor n=1 Tax=Sphingomonas sp. TaxID=28214 RepID=UPI001ACFBF10|nr:TonB-dependent receptor [Sphingomonas sp.]MBN8816345.1 TonB-dependent receptor [Sphingomonas sp.]